MTEEKPKPRLSRRVVTVLSITIVHGLLASISCSLAVFYPYSFFIAHFAGIVFFSFPLVGIFLFFVAKAGLKKSNGSLRGYRYAIAGLIFTIVITLLLLVFMDYANHTLIRSGTHY